MSTELVLRVAGSGLDLEELAQVTAALHREVLELDVSGVRRATMGGSPDLAKSGTAVAIDTLLIAATPAVVAGVVGVVSSWLSRQPRQIEVEIDGHKLSGVVTAAQRDSIVASFLARVQTDQTDRGTSTSPGPTDNPT
nr:hypothetical protein OHB51_17345 [Micromonospora sp. NBC_00855]